MTNPQPPWQNPMNAPASAPAGIHLATQPAGPKTAPKIAPTNAPTNALTTAPFHAPRKLKLATVSLAGCFGCHMSFLDLDERLLPLFDLVEFDRSPLTDIKTLGHCDIGLIEGGLCNAENVHLLREFRVHCQTLVAVGACAINGGLPALRNAMDVGQIMRDVYVHQTGLGAHSQVPNDPELPLPLNRVHAIHEVVHVDHFLPGCPPSADAFWELLTALMARREPELGPRLMHYD